MPTVAGRRGVVAAAAPAFGSMGAAKRTASKGSSAVTRWPGGAAKDCKHGTSSPLRRFPGASKAAKNGDGRQMGPKANGLSVDTAVSPLPQDPQKGFSPKRVVALQTRFVVPSAMEAMGLQGDALSEPMREQGFPNETHGGSAPSSPGRAKALARAKFELACDVWAESSASVRSRRTSTNVSEDWQDPAAAAVVLSVAEKAARLPGISGASDESAPVSGGALVVAAGVPLLPAPAGAWQEDPADEVNPGHPEAKDCIAQEMAGIGHCGLTSTAQRAKFTDSTGATTEDVCLEERAVIWGRNPGRRVPLAQVQPSATDAEEMIHSAGPPTPAVVGNAFAPVGASAAGDAVQSPQSSARSPAASEASNEIGRLEDRFQKLEASLGSTNQEIQRVCAELSASRRLSAEAGDLALSISAMASPGARLSVPTPKVDDVQDSWPAGVACSTSSSEWMWTQPGALTGSLAKVSRHSSLHAVDDFSGPAARTSLSPAHGDSSVPSMGAPVLEGTPVMCPGSCRLGPALSAGLSPCRKVQTPGSGQGSGSRKEAAPSARLMSRFVSTPPVPGLVATSPQPVLVHCSTGQFGAATSAAQGRVPTVGVRTPSPTRMRPGQSSSVGSSPGPTAAFPRIRSSSSPPMPVPVLPVSWYAVAPPFGGTQQQHQEHEQHQQPGAMGAAEGQRMRSCSPLSVHNGAGFAPIGQRSIQPSVSQAPSTEAARKLSSRFVMLSPGHLPIESLAAARGGHVAGGNGHACAAPTVAAPHPTPRWSSGAVATPRAQGGLAVWEGTPPPPPRLAGGAFSPKVGRGSSRGSGPLSVSPGFVSSRGPSRTRAPSPSTNMMAATAAQSTPVTPTTPRRLNWARYELVQAAHSPCCAGVGAITVAGVVQPGTVSAPGATLTTGAGPSARGRQGDTPSRFRPRERC